MSTNGSGNPPATEEDKIRQLMQKLMDDQDKIDQDFREQQNVLLERTRQAQESLLHKISNSPMPELPPGIDEIVTLLTQYPMLIPLTKLFLQKKIAALQAAIQKAINETT